MKKKICIVLCLGCIGTVSVVGCSNKNFDSKVTGDNQTTTENVSDILNDQEKKEGGYENESSSNADDKENSADDSEVLANADLRGAVLEFSDTGCNISIGRNESGENSIWRKYLFSDFSFNDDGYYA